MARGAFRAFTLVIAQKHWNKIEWRNNNESNEKKNTRTPSIFVCAFVRSMKQCFPQIQLDVWLKGKWSLSWTYVVFFSNSCRFYYKKIVQYANGMAIFKKEGLPFKFANLSTYHICDSCCNQTHIKHWPFRKPQSTTIALFYTTVVEWQLFLVCLIDCLWFKPISYSILSNRISIMFTHHQPHR